MTDKLIEIRERHNKVYTPAERDGYYYDIDTEDAHNDRGYLLERITELETQLDKVRNCQTYVVELDDCEQSWFKKTDVLEALEGES